MSGIVPQASLTWLCSRGDAAWVNEKGRDERVMRDAESLEMFKLSGRDKSVASRALALTRSAVKAAGFKLAS